MKSDPLASVDRAALGGVANRTTRTKTSDLSLPDGSKVMRYSLSAPRPPVDSSRQQTVSFPPAKPPPFATPDVASEFFVATRFFPTKTKWRIPQLSSPESTFTRKFGPSFKYFLLEVDLGGLGGWGEGEIDSLAHRPVLGLKRFNWSSDLPSFFCGSCWPPAGNFLLGVVWRLEIDHLRQPFTGGFS